MTATNSNFKNLGPLLGETRTAAICEICSNYIYVQIYQDPTAKNKQKKVFVCKNCLSNDKV